MAVERARYMWPLSSRRALGAGFCGWSGPSDGHRASPSSTALPRPWPRHSSISLSLLLMSWFSVTINWLYNLTLTGEPNSFIYIFFGGVSSVASNFLITFFWKSRVIRPSTIIIPNTRDYSQLQDLELRPVKTWTHMANGILWVWVEDLEIGWTQGHCKVLTSEAGGSQSGGDLKMLCYQLWQWKWPWVQECRWPSEAGRGKGYILPWTLWEERSLRWHFDFRTPDFRTVR